MNSQQHHVFGIVVAYGLFAFVTTVGFAYAAHYLWHTSMSAVVTVWIILLCVIPFSVRGLKTSRRRNDSG